jgi:hypothetical protein
MTNTSMNSRKLSLRRESLRELTTDDLERVAGGTTGSIPIPYPLGPKAK